MEQLLFGILIFVAFYFILMRPQLKRAKEQKILLLRLKIDDEVCTAGGIIGRIIYVHFNDPHVIISLSNSATLVINKTSIVALVPKGSLNAKYRVLSKGNNKVKKSDDNYDVRTRKPRLRSNSVNKNNK